MTWFNRYGLSALRTICVTDDHINVPFVAVTKLSYFPLLLPITGLLTRAKHQVPLVEQELLTFPGHNPQILVCCSIISLMCRVLWIMVSLLVSFRHVHLVIVLSVLLRFTAFHYPFGIFKLLLLKKD
jgi:hypothetical protein